MAFTRIAQCSGQSKATSTPAVTTASLTYSVGDLLIATCAIDSRSGGQAFGSASPQVSPTNNTGMVFTALTATLVDPSSAAGLVAIQTYWCIATANQTDTFTFTPDNTIVAKTITVTQYSTEGTVSVVTSSAATTSGNGTTISLSNGGTLQAGDLVVGFFGFEGTSGDGPGTDTDTLNGSWFTSAGAETSGGGAASNINSFPGLKVVTAAGTQTWNPSLTTGRDWAASIVAFRDTIPPKGIVAPRKPQLLMRGRR